MMSLLDVALREMLSEAGCAEEAAG